MPPLEAPGHSLYLFCALSIRYFFSLLSTKKDAAIVPCAANPMSFSTQQYHAKPFSVTLTPHHSERSE